MGEITLDSTVKDVYAHPIGRDIIRRLLLQMNLSESLIDNPLTGRLRLRTVRRLTAGRLGAGFFDTFLRLLNSEKDRPASGDCPVRPAWWKEAIFYQIYPRAFCDGNGDGMGDLKGILEKLDYLKELGVDALWLSPVYDSPQDDNGYDIRDYRKIWEGFGSMKDFDALLEAVHSRGMRLIMDLVVNHTSDEHEWFQSALRDRESPYGEYYFFRPGQGKDAPNNWTSFFSGSAWRYFEEREEWGLHLFSKKQMDLNWENPALRAEILDMIKWWLEKGVDGFRMDVVNYISKTEGLPDGEEMIGQLMGYYGIEHYFYGPRLHEYLRELRQKAFEPYGAFSVGETPGVGMEMSRLLTGDDRGELDMVFSFDHLENPGHVRFDDYRYNLNYLKSYYMDWTKHYGNHCWLSLFLENHDNPRMVSKVEPDRRLHPALAKLLLTVQLTLRGTPFLYQGQELGAGNVDFHGIEELRDVESINLYRELLREKTSEEAFATVLAGSRDHARAMMDWEQAEGQRKEDTSVYGYCRRLTALRRSDSCFIYGEVEFTNERKKDLFTYFRRQCTQAKYVECNLSNRAIKKPRCGARLQKLLGNYDGAEGCGTSENAADMLQPYEVNIYQALSGS